MNSIFYPSSSIVGEDSLRKMSTKIKIIHLTSEKVTKDMIDKVTFNIH